MRQPAMPSDKKPTAPHLLTIAETQPDDGLATVCCKWIGVFSLGCVALSLWLFAYLSIFYWSLRLPEEVFRGPQPYSQFHSSPSAQPVDR